MTASVESQREESTSTSISILRLFGPFGISQVLAQYNFLVLFTGGEINEIKIKNAVDVLKM